MRWVFQRQALEGGFNGRANKLVDGCYSFWQLGGIAVTDTNHLALFDHFRLQRYILATCQYPSGGLLDKSASRQICTIRAMFCLGFVCHVCAANSNVPVHRLKRCSTSHVKKCLKKGDYSTNFFICFSLSVFSFVPLFFRISIVEESL